jgi:hypothetical protein
VGTLTVIADSPLGLPSDDLYGLELGRLRDSGRRLAEISSLAVDEGLKDGSQVLVQLFNFSYLVARRVYKATDFVITVNPRHVKFYCRKFLFDFAGSERSYDKVGGAPAVLLSIPLEMPDRVVEPQRSRTIYHHWMSAAEERSATAVLRRSLRPMTEQEIFRFLVRETDLLARASARVRHYLQHRYLAYDWETIRPREL